MADQKTFAKQVLIFGSISALLILSILLILKAFNVFLLIFAGILLAIFLIGIGRFISRYIPIKETYSVSAAILLMLLLSTGMVLFMGPNIVEGFSNLSKEIPSSLEKLEQSIKDLSWGQRLIDEINNLQEQAMTDQNLAERVGGIFSTTLGSIVNIFVILIIGIYTAYSPRYYIKGITAIVPPKHRDKAEDIMHSLGKALGWWLVGRFASMAIVGIMTALGLWILGVPLAGTLGFLAALLSFIPNIGPIISAVPAILVGLIQSPATALYVVLLYIGIQTVESYLLTPQIEKKAVSLPPALLIVWQILMGVLTGIFGLLLATPLLVVIIVIIQKLYIKEGLKEEVKILGE